jgi:hypothetical protein
MSRAYMSRASGWANEWVSLVRSSERLRWVWIGQVGVPLTGQVSLLHLLSCSTILKLMFCDSVLEGSKNKNPSHRLDYPL